MTVGFAAFREPWGHSVAMAQAADAPVNAAAFGAYLLRAIASYMPGLALGAVGYALYLRRESEGRSKTLWCLAAALFAVMAFLGPLMVDSAMGVSHAPSQIQAPAPAPAPAHLPHSGEVVLTPDRSACIRVADPRHPDGDAVEEGWQRLLWTSMAEAIKNGEEQVVMVFTRQHCPWCDRLQPVLQRAIAKRAAAIAEGSAVGGGLLQAPLRIFTYDAQEFMPVVQQFQLEGFPTILAFGRPGVKPRMVPGYLGDEDFERLIVDTAEAEPEPPKGARKKRRWFR
eukprot:CAMPEP_0172677016 /NCGR_PEP_ID=MMETSP1074-20121228/14386_1 /TAXON_ID=2916 /ORGANISM="Ceratium fusus, Strain PA161109" /LENGTH=282 /DNA_ID=CAMNT_0013494785 /DNA_START=10 /DNA_END=858 /DNA_ORIENTATION=+